MDAKSEITDADVRDADAHIVTSACVRLCVWDQKRIPFYFFCDVKNCNMVLFPEPMKCDPLQNLAEPHKFESANRRARLF